MKTRPLCILVPLDCTPEGESVLTEGGNTSIAVSLNSSAIGSDHRRPLLITHAKDTAVV